MKKYISIAIFIVGGLLLTPGLYAQQDPQFTHYMYNTLSVNPAYAGSRGLLNISALHRQQWIGLDGAPMTQTVFVHSPLRNRKMALGFSAVNDRIGPLNQTFLYGDYSYTVKLTELLRLSFGVKAGVHWFQPKISTLSTIAANDPSFVNSTVENTIKPNVGGGIYLHHENWYFGASSPRMIESNFNLGNSSSGDTTQIRELRHYFFIAGGIFPVSPAIKLKPTAKLKMVQNAPFSIDATVEALLDNRFSIGAGMRLNDCFYGMVGYQFSDQFKAGLSYDFSTTKIQKVSNGTVEIMLSYDFLFNNNKLKSPRYF
ncbi:MAG: hypothetical protein FD123_3931 [Bacteroidetes bacterium]|nr:MAG: hypothetical protein FD123_3931 [Bacteroidota bacterium]